MFLLVNLIEVDVFALKEEICMSNTKFLAEVGRLRPHSTEATHGGSRWHNACSTCWALLVGFAEANVPVLLAGVSFCEVLISFF